MMRAVMGRDLNRRRVLGNFREVRCRVCGSADCLGALDHIFQLCNNQRPGFALAPEQPLPPADHDARTLPGQLFLFPGFEVGDGTSTA